MLWTDIETIDEFFQLEPVNEDFYDLYLSLRKEPFAVQTDAVKLFNEVYYQVTRMAFEKPMPTDLDKYLSDIKANMGWNYSAELVMSMAYFLFSLIEKNERPLNKFFTKSVNERIGGCLYWKPYKHLFERLKKEGRRVKYRFKPRPCSPKELQSMYVNWPAITHQFDLSALDHVVHLWSKKYRDDVATMIADSLLGMFSSSRKVDKAQINRFLEQFQKKDHYSEELCSLCCAEPIMSYEEQKLQERINMIEMEKVALQGRVAELEAENERLNALLEKKKSNGTARKFTLVQIVDYCKGCVTWDEAKEIVRMLNKLLRRIGTPEDSDLVDSVEDEFKKRTYGHTNIAHQTVIPKVEHYYNDVETVENKFPSLPPMDEPNKKIE